VLAEMGALRFQLRQAGEAEAAIVLATRDPGRGVIEGFVQPWRQEQP
jgi:hypothetical protein